MIDNDNYDGVDDDDIDDKFVIHIEKINQSDLISVIGVH